MPAPRVSVILCTFNRRHLLERAIRSVRRQTLKEYELIVIDDGSTDGTGAHLREFLRGERRVRYTYQENSGLAGARNAGLRRARGTYVAFLDSDDEYTPRHLERLTAYLDAHADVDGVRGTLTPVGPRNRHYVPDVDHPGRRIHVSRCHAAGTLVVRRSCLARVGGFRRIPFSEDYDLIRRLEAAGRVERVGLRTYRYHVDADHRLCDVYAKDGVAGIRRMRRKGRGMAGATRTARKPSSRS